MARYVVRPVTLMPKTAPHRECAGRGWSLATWSLMGGTYLRFCECETGQKLKEAVEVRERRRAEGMEA